MLALAALILGLVVMHHVAGIGGHGDRHGQAGPPTPASQAHHDADLPAAAAGSDHTPDTPTGSSGTHLLHLCLAILSAAVLLLLTRPWRRVPPARMPRGVAAAQQQQRAPVCAPYGSALLARLCVMRT